jgi:hypothetical protein
MASHAFDNWQVMSETSKRHKAPELKLVAPLFTHREFQVIELARRDSIWSIRPRSWLVRLVGRLFGIHPTNPLADPRLETIRRFAVAAKSGDSSSTNVEYRQFQDAGFSPGHADFIAQRMTEKLPLSQR